MHFLILGNLKSGKIVRLRIILGTHRHGTHSRNLLGNVTLVLHIYIYLKILNERAERREIEDKK